MKENIPEDNILYINFEDERLLGATSGDMENLFEKYQELFNPKGDKKIYLFFDEIQNVDGWANWVRRIYDTKKNVRIILTGSSSKLLSKEISTSLRGRTYNLEIFPFSFKEFLRLKGISFKNSQEIYNGRLKIKRFFKKYLREGGFPFTTLNKSLSSDEILQEYYNSMIFRDVVERYKIRDVQKLQILAKFTFESIAKEISYSKLSNKMKSLGFELTRNTVQDYISYFEEAYLFFQVLRYEYSLTKQLGSVKKVYSIDNGLLNSVSFKFSKDEGKLLENLVFLEIYRRHKKVFFNRGKFECDFVVQEKDKVISALQVCYDFNKSNEKREINGLLEAMEKFNLEEGLILTFDSEKELKISEKKVLIKPVWKWLLEF